MEGEMIIFLLVVTVLAVVLWILCAHLNSRAGHGYSSDWGFFCGFFAGLATIVASVFFIVWGVAALDTRTTVNDMVTFYESNQHNYRYAVENTEDVNIVAAEPGLIDVAYLEQGKLTGMRIQEFRDRVNLYNRTLRNYRDKNTHWFLGAFYHNPPDYLKPIVLTE